MTFEELAPLIQPPDTGETIDERFAAFHKANPHVYSVLKKEALRMKWLGFKKFGMKSLFEVLRWQSGIQTQGEPWKLNNDFTACYARKLMAEVPALEGFFEVRERKSGKEAV